MTTTLKSTLHENSTSEFRNFTKEDLEIINNERALTLLPAMIVLGILMIVGIVGNSLVCYVFCFRLKSGTQNFLIVCLALLDLLSCAIAIPNEIADMRFYYDFQSKGACKIMRFITTFCAIGSIFTLLVIAIDRYRKICKPLNGQLQMNHVRLSLIPVFAAAIFFSWPAIVMYGLRTTETTIPGLMGQDCSTPDGISDTMYPLLYNCILFLCFIIIAASLIIIYSFVLRETKRHNRYLKRNSDYNIPSSGQYYSEDSHSSAEAPSGNKTSSSSNNTSNRTVQFVYGSNSTVQTTVDAPTKDATLISVSRSVDISQEEHPIQITQEASSYQIASPHNSDISTTKVSFTDSFLPSQESDTLHSINSPNLVKNSSLSSSGGNPSKDLRTVLFNDNVSVTRQTTFKKRKRIKSKTTIIAFLVTLVFILSFLPHLSLQVTKMLHKGFDYNLEGSALVAYNLFLRSYFINSVSNPIIYGALNVYFSNEVKLLARKLCGKS